MKVWVGGIVGRYYEPDHVGSILRLLPALNAETGRPAVYRPRFNDALLDRARSRNATEFLVESDADVHLSLDSDIVFEPGDAIAICKAALQTKGIVGGQYITRRKGGRHCFPTSLLPDGVTVTYGESHELVPAKYVSGGFVAVHRKVFETLRDGPKMPLLHGKESAMAFYPFYQPFWVDGNEEKIYLSEDWALCERARRAGLPVHLDPGVRLLHLGMHPYRLEDMLQPPLPVQEMRLTREGDGNFIIDAPYYTAPGQDGSTPGFKERK